MIWRCDLQAQYNEYRSEILAAIEAVLESGRYTMADNVRDFESDFADYLNIDHCRTLASGTDALIVALKVAEITSGDEVITTPFTAIPTISAIVAAGGKPVFIDIDESTYLMNSGTALSAVNQNTKAILPVHIFGNVFDTAALKSDTPARIWIIEDTAQAHGSTIRGIHAGTMGDMGAFSFYPTKNLGGYGDGGALAFSNPEHAPRIERIRQYGMLDKDHISCHGINSRMDELQAAVLKTKLQYLEQMNEKRRKIAAIYTSELSDLIDFQSIPGDVVGNFHVMVGRVNGNRDNLITRMAESNIQCNVYYPVPLHLQEANRYLGYKAGDMPIAEKLCREAIALPMYPELPEDALHAVIETIKKEMRGAHARAI